MTELGPMTRAEKAEKRLAELWISLDSFADWMEIGTVSVEEAARKLRENIITPLEKETV